MHFDLLTGSDSLGQKSSIDTNVRSSHKTAGFMAGKKQSCADQFARFTEPPHGSVAPNRLGSRRGRTIVVKEQLAVLFGRKKTGGDGVDPHAFAGPFACEKLG